MPENDPESGGLRERILGSLFDKVSEDEAAALVGILFEYRIVLSRTFWSLLRRHSVSVPLEPLDPQAASILVGSLFGMDCDELFLAFQRKWSELRNSPRARSLVAAIQLHEFVERLEPWSPLP